MLDAKSKKQYTKLVYTSNVNDKEEGIKIVTGLTVTEIVVLKSKQLSNTK